MRVALLGRTRMLFDCIEKIQKLGHEIVLIGTCHAAPEYDVKENDFENIANQLGITFFNDVHINDDDVLNILRGVKADIAISVNWLTIVGEEAIKCFKYGILNAHCGDLPRYRGNAAPNWAIINGEDSYTICIHFMLPGELDAGNVVVREAYFMDETTTITHIYSNMIKVIPDLFCRAIEIIEKQGAVGIPQCDEPDASLRCYPRIPTDSYIDFEKNRRDILRNVRASTHPFKGAFFYLNGIKIYVHEVEDKPYLEPCCVYPGQVMRVDRKTGEIEVAARDGVIIIKKIYLDDVEYSATDIIKSSRIRLNYHIHDEIYSLRKELEVQKSQILRLKAILEENGFIGNNEDIF